MSVVTAPYPAQKSESSSCQYWLGHCEGYRVETLAGHLGYVEEVVWAPDDSEPVGLKVRATQGTCGLIVLTVGQIEEIIPLAERIVVVVDVDV